MNNLLKKIPPALKILGRQTVFFYLLVALLLSPFLHFHTAKMQARSSALSRYIPDFAYLIRFRDQEAPVDRERMQTYYDYFKKVDSYLSNKSDVLGLLGYCSYYNNDKNAARKYYLQATISFPYSFALFYNLGALYYEQGDYVAATQYFDRALKMDFKQNLQFISSSRIYFPLIKTPMNVDEELNSYMKLGYERCYRLLIVSLYRVQDYNQQFRYSLHMIDSPVQDPAFFYFHAGLASYKLKSFNRAAAFFQKALKLGPDDEMTAHYLGLSLQELNMPNMANNLLGRKKKNSGKDAKENPKVILQIF